MPGIEKPDISTVIITCNSAHFIRRCLVSVYAQEIGGREVIVVDNGSHDATADFIRAQYPEVVLIKNQHNLGACKARNQGIGLARGEWVLTLDCDIVLDRVFFMRLTDALTGLSPEVGMLQPKILNADQATVYSAGILLSPLKRFYDIGRGRPDGAAFKSSRYIYGACAASAVYRRAMLEDIKERTGYFDERFFFLVEDVDVACRARQKGWKALFCPEVVCFHDGNSSLTNAPMRQYLSWRNRRLFLAKQKPRIFTQVMLCVCYDSWRLAFLFLVNPYVRRALRNHGLRVLFS
jgi:GT2 family glycosyltransferase